jgi:hypothetical protein
MILGLIGIAVSLLLGYFITGLLWPSAVSSTLALLFCPAIGIGLCSIIYVVFRRPIFVVEGGLLLILAVSWFVLRRPATPSLSWAWLSDAPGVYILLACGLGMALSYWIIRVDRSPYGDGDAVAIWTSHARYLYRDGPSWQKTILNTFHADYPLLTSATTARLWRYMGQEMPEAAGMLGVLYALATLGVLTGSLAYFRGPSRAALFGLTLLGTPFYLDYATSQSADVPLSLYVLVTIALICFQANETPEKLGPLVLAGFAAGCAGWTKNEGLLFIAATLLALLTPAFWKMRDTLRRLSAFLAGIALPLAMILWFKFAVAPPNDIFGGRHYAEVIQKVANPQRYATVLFGLSDNFWSFGDWMMNPILLLFGYVALQRLDRRMLLNTGWIQGVFICATVLIGYGAVYLITPEDLQWHIDSSLPRLYLHLWPAFLLLTGLIAAENKGRNDLLESHHA